MRRVFGLCIMFFTCTVLSSVSVVPTPYGARLGLSAPKGTVYTDIYVDNLFISRLDGSAEEYELTGLQADGTYDLAIAYRDGENNDISADFATFETTNWSGEYLWVNKTDEDNKGRVREFRLQVRTVHDETYGQYNEMYIMIDGKTYRLFPLFDLGEPTGWVDYDDSTEQAICYRNNAERFIKSSLTPSRWRLTKMEVSPLKAVSYVETVAFGFSIDCTTSFTFFLDEDGGRHVSFLITGPSLLRSFFFYSPNGESEGGAFILDAVSTD